MNCPACGAENPDDAKYCSLCMTNFADYRHKVEEEARREEQNAYSDTGEALDIDFSRPQTSTSASLESALNNIPPSSESDEKKRRWSFESGPLKVIIACGVIILLTVAGLFIFIFARTSGKATFNARGTSLQFEYPSLWQQQKIGSSDDSSRIFETPQGEMQIQKVAELKGMEGNTTKQVLRVFVIAQDVSLGDLNYLASSLLSANLLATNNAIENNGDTQNPQLSPENLDLIEVRVNGDEGISGSLEMGFLSNPTKNYFLSFNHDGVYYIFSMAGENSETTDRTWNEIVDSIRFEE